MLNKKIYSSKNLIIYGKHAVLSAANNPQRTLKTLYVTKQTWPEVESYFQNVKLNIRFTSKEEFTKLLPPNSNHQNIALETLPLKPTLLEDIINQTSHKEKSCVIILDQVQDPHNIGAIIRTAAAFSVDAVIIPENNSPKENNTIIKCSAGGIDAVALVYVNNVVTAIKSLKHAGYWVTGLDGSGENEIGAKVFSNKTVLILGSEESGMRKLVRENCDFLAKIPISSKVESLNVSNAAAIALYLFKNFSNKS